MRGEYALRLITGIFTFLNFSIVFRFGNCLGFGNWGLEFLPRFRLDDTTDIRIVYSNLCRIIRRNLAHVALHIGFCFGLFRIVKYFLGGAFFDDSAEI